MTLPKDVESRFDELFGLPVRDGTAVKLTVGSDTMLIGQAEIKSFLATEIETAVRRERERIANDIGKHQVEIMEAMYKVVDSHKRIRSEGTRERVKIVLSSMWYEICAKLSYLACTTDGAGKEVVCGEDMITKVPACGGTCPIHTEKGKED